LGVENVNEEIWKLTQEIEKFDIKIQDLNEKIPSVIEKYKQEALEAEKKSKKIQDYLEEMKKTFNELKHFYTKEELKNYLDKKRWKIE
jgi:primosomal protein N''